MAPSPDMMRRSEAFAGSFTVKLMRWPPDMNSTFASIAPTETLILSVFSLMAVVPTQAPEVDGLSMAHARSAEMTRMIGQSWQN